MTAKTRCLVTGAAGFIGSALARRLLHEGCQVIGIDCFTDFYDLKIKENNISDLTGNPNFSLHKIDLVDIGDSSFEGIQWVFHQAAQAGVRASWGQEFSAYTNHNVLATQRLLEWSRHNKPERFVFASSSSVYGETDKLPMHEDDLPKPLSPYGVSKLAAEHLCNLYSHNFAVPTISLRYFTVYGPGQRPDMAFHRFIKAICNDQPVNIFGNGEQTRDFTYVDDIVEANLAAASASGCAGRVYNIGGGSRISINGVLEVLGRLIGKSPNINYLPREAGDPKHTYADTDRALNELSFRPKVKLEEGLSRMINSF